MSAGIAGFYLGLCPGSHAGEDTKKFQKDQTNPHDISEYPKPEQQGDQVTWKSEFLVSIHTAFSLSHDHFPSQLVAVPGGTIKTEMRNRKQPLGIEPSTPPFPESVYLPRGRPSQPMVDMGLGPHQNPPQSSKTVLNHRKSSGPANHRPK